MRSLRLLLISIALSGCATSKGVERAFTFDGSRYSLTAYRPSSRGLFFLTPYDLSKETLPATPALLIVNSDGEPIFQKKIVDQTGWLHAFDFRPIENGLYGYFLCYLSQTDCLRSSYRFLDADFNDVIPRITPDHDPDLNAHEVVRAGDGHYFFLFTRPDLAHQRKNSEIQEWTPDGKIVFSWRSEDHPELFRHSSSQRPSNYRITSFDLDPDGNIIMAFYNQNEIVKIEYPSGRVLFEISEETWKYRHDPLPGVVTPHSLRVLPDRHLLVFDDGDGSSRHPARAVEYKLDERNRTAEWVWEYRAPAATQDMTRVGGSVQRLTNGHTVIGWGIATDIKKRLPMNPQSYLLMSEVDSDDRVVREISVDHPMASYRVFYLDQSRSGNRL